MLQKTKGLFLRVKDLGYIVLRLILQDGELVGTQQSFYQTPLCWWAWKINISEVIILDQLAILVGSQFYLKKKHFPKQRINHVCLFSISFIIRTGNLVGFSSQ